MHFFEKHLRHDAKKYKNSKKSKTKPIIIYISREEIVSFLDNVYFAYRFVFYHCMAHNNAFAKLVSNFND